MRREAGSRSNALRTTVHAIAGMAVVVGLIGAASLLRAQSPTPALRPEFEVATIKPNKSGTIQTSLDLQPGGRFIATNVAVLMLVNFAYGEDGPLGPNRLVISEAWPGGRAVVISERYDIQAKAAGDLAREQLPHAVRRLLAERFKLAVHHETRTLPGYDLVMAAADRRPGPRLRRADVDCSKLGPDGNSSCGFRSFPGKASGRVTMKDFARRVLANALEDRRPVQDATALEGTFEFELDWVPDGAAPVRPPDAPPAPPIDPNGASLFTALREQLGLKLEPRKEQIDVVVIDHAEHPTPD
jgi:uncharacterized protein (TIGR03435 family)